MTRFDSVVDGQDVHYMHQTDIATSQQTRCRLTTVGHVRSVGTADNVSGVASGSGGGGGAQ